MIIDGAGYIGYMLYLSIRNATTGQQSSSSASNVQMMNKQAARVSVLAMEQMDRYTVPSLPLHFGLVKQ